MKINLIKNSFVNISNNIYDSDFINLAKINNDKLSFDEDTLFLSKKSKDRLNLEKIDKNDECVYLFKYLNSYGIIADLDMDEYISGNIKCHEMVLPNAIQGMIANYSIYNSETAPIFVVHKKEIDYIEIIKQKNYLKEYHFDDIDLYVYSGIYAKQILKKFSNIKNMYLADGHHRLYSSSMLEYRKTILSCFFSFSQVMINPIHRIIKNVDATTFENAKNFISNFLKIFEDSDLKKGFVRISYQSDSFIVKLNSSENNLLWNNDVFRMNTQIIFSAFRNLNLLNLEYITDSNISYTKRNISKNDVLIELYPMDINEFLELSNMNCILPPKSTSFYPKFPSFLIFKKYR